MKENVNQTNIDWNKKKDLWMNEMKIVLVFGDAILKSKAILKGDDFDLFKSAIDNFSSVYYAILADTISFSYMGIDYHAIDKGLLNKSINLLTKK